MSCKNQTPETHGPCGICSECVKFPDPSPDLSLRSGLEVLVDEWRRIALRFDALDMSMGLGWRECAKQAETLLLLCRSRAGEQETDR